VIIPVQSGTAGVITRRHSSAWMAGSVDAATTTMR